jgi:hypothetical protein
MRIHYHGERAERSAHFPMWIAPAGDIKNVKPADVLKEWTQADGSPKQIEIVFKYGVAEVDDAIGRYMVATGLAHRASILRVIRQKLFNRNGEPIDEIFDSEGRPIILADKTARA